MYSGRDSLKNPGLSQVRSTTITTQSERYGRKQSTANISQAQYIQKNNIIYKNKESFALFMKIIGEIQLRARSSNVLQPFMELFVLDVQFEKLCSQFTRTICDDILGVVSYSKNSLEESGLLDDDADNFKPDFCARDIHTMSQNDQKLLLCGKHVGNSH
jgi:hypothetical protein